MLIVKTTKALLLLLCLAVLTSGCSSISRLQEFPEPPQAFGGTRQNIIHPLGLLVRGYDFVTTFVPIPRGSAAHGFGTGAAMAGLLLLPLVLPAIIVDIPLTLAAAVVVLAVSIPAELWWYSQNKGAPDEPEAPGDDGFKTDPEGLPSIEDLDAAEEARTAEDVENLDELEDLPGDD